MSRSADGFSRRRGDGRPAARPATADRISAAGRLDEHQIPAAAKAPALAVAIPRLRWARSEPQADSHQHDNGDSEDNAGEDLCQQPAGVCFPCSNPRGTIRPY
jgi:hypothetical protein